MTKEEFEEFVCYCNLNDIVWTVNNAYKVTSYNRKSKSFCIESLYEGYYDHFQVNESNYELFSHKVTGEMKAAIEIARKLSVTTISNALGNLQIY